jgi:hypothetical protein
VIGLSQTRSWTGRRSRVADRNAADEVALMRAACETLDRAPASVITAISVTVPARAARDDRPVVAERGRRLAEEYCLDFEMDGRDGPSVHDYSVRFRRNPDGCRDAARV